MYRNFRSFPTEAEARSYCVQEASVSGLWFFTLAGGHLAELLPNGLNQLIGIAIGIAISVNVVLPALFSEEDLARQWDMIKAVIDLLLGGAGELPLSRWPRPAL